MADVLGGSFRDPAGFVYRHAGVVYRQVNDVGSPDYQALMDSGLYAELVKAALLIRHEEVPAPADVAPDHAKTLRPEAVEFISYPYEWCFGQLRDAALATLEIQRRALARGLSLKDANAYNIQFHRGRPVLIDTLSFERYREGEPWVAYRQFCQHFLAPLALMHYRDVRLGEWSRLHLDGIPLDLAAKLLPMRAWLRLSLWMNLKLHARSQRRYAGGAAPASATRVSKTGLGNILASLEAGVRKLRFEPGGSEWSDYDAEGSYGDGGLEEKKAVVARWLGEMAPHRVWDLGANTGDFSRIACEAGARVVAFDVDPGAVERNYRRVREAGETALLPLRIDLCNPSPAQGFAHRERASLVERAGPDCVLALALVHHLAISNNLPLERIAEFLALLSPRLVIEFVPKGDPRVETLLATRPDIFPEYQREGFERAFSVYFEIEEAAALPGSERRLYRMLRRAHRA